MNKAHFIFLKLKIIIKLSGVEALAKYTEMMSEDYDEFKNYEEDNDSSHDSYEDFHDEESDEEEYWEKIF
jgi:hypothetical protein